MKLTGYATAFESQGKKEVYKNGLITYASPVHHRYDKDILKKYKNKEVGAARSWIKWFYFKSTIFYLDAFFNI